MTAVSTVSAAVLDTLTFSIEQDYGKSQEVLKLSKSYGTVVYECCQEKNETAYNCRLHFIL